MVNIKRSGKNGNRKRRRRPQAQSNQSCEHNDKNCAKCSGMTNKEMNEAIERNIEKFGRHLTGIGAGEDSPPFMYSTGLARNNLPELIIFGLSMDLCAHFINRLGKEMMDGKRFKPDVPYFGYTNKEYPFMFLEVPQTIANEHMLITKQYYPTFKTWQFVWTDTKGKFPWETAFEHDRFKDIQPIVGIVPES